jgi:hypothetical protein
MDSAFDSWKFLERLAFLVREVRSEPTSCHLVSSLPGTEVEAIVEIRDQEGA